MAWTGTTTQLDPIVLKFNGAVINSTTVSTVMGQSTRGRDLYGGAASVHMTTGTDVIRIPFNSANGKMVIAAEVMGGVGTFYGTIALRLPPSSDQLSWQTKSGLGTSTAESGWEVIASTQSYLATATNSAMYAFGPFDSARYGHWFGGTSSASIDKYQPYLEVMVGQATSTAFLAMQSTTLNFIGVNVWAYELP